MSFLNFTKKDLDTVTEYIDYHVGLSENVTIEYIERILYRTYRLYAHKFKDSHRAMLKYKLKMRGHLSLDEISDKFGIEKQNIAGRWRNTVIRRLYRYVGATIRYEQQTPLDQLDYEDIVNICDLSKRAEDLMKWYGLDNYEDLRKFLESYKPDVCHKIAGTNFGEETYRELLLAEATLRKDFGKRLF